VGGCEKHWKEAQESTQEFGDEGWGHGRRMRSGRSKLLVGILCTVTEKPAQMVGQNNNNNNQCRIGSRTCSIRNPEPICDVPPCSIRYLRKML